MAEKLDVILFGASGFTGKYAVPQVYKFTKNNDKNLSWGIAGRSQKKLEDTLKETAKILGVEDLSWVPVIIADINDEESIKRMTDRARVIINCCGPYGLYGEVVIKACLETGTHIVDVSAELPYIEKAWMQYGQAFADKEIYMVSACGTGYLPEDLGITFLEEHFKGTVNSVEIYMKIQDKNPPGSPPIVHSVTWESCIDSLSKLSSLQSVTPTPKELPKLDLNLWPLHKKDDEAKWAVPFAVANVDIIQRSQRYFYENEGKRPVQAQCYLVLNSFINLAKFLFLAIIVMVLAQLKIGRQLLLKYPKLFSAGFFSHEEPTNESVKNSSIEYTLYGTGWDEKLAKGINEFKKPPNKSMTAKIIIVSPGYGFATIALTLGAIILLTEKEKLPKRGGVYSTAAAFSKTSMLKQLQENGAKFEIVSTKIL